MKRVLVGAVLVAVVACGLAAVVIFRGPAAPQTGPLTVQVLKLELDPSLREPASYDRQDVERAFLQHGFDLRNVKFPGLSGADPAAQSPVTGVLLSPLTREQFLVFVGPSNKYLQATYGPGVEQKTAHYLLRGNVVALRQEALGRRDWLRVRAAMNDL